jgi:hypothetical protein
MSTDPELEAAFKEAVSRAVDELLDEQEEDVTPDPADFSRTSGSSSEPQARKTTP